MKNPKNNLHTFVILAYETSPHLEACIKSVIDQDSDVIIATTTPNPRIKNLAQKYSLKLITGKHTSLGGDFDFAKNSATTPLVTIAHQDDLYEPNYTKEVVAAYQKYPNSAIIFTDYYEIRGRTKVKSNKNLKIKRILLFPMKLTKSTNKKWLKRTPLAFGCAICCPAVTFVTKNCPKSLFASDFKCNVDWHAWETLSKKPHAFTFIPQILMGHRISKDSTTTDSINSGIRTKEDYQLFRRFWPKPIAKALTKFYQSSEDQNQF